MTRNRRTAWIGAIAALAWACALEEPTVATSGRPLFNTAPGEGRLEVCKDGPNGSTATFTISATGGQLLVSSPFTLSALTGVGCLGPKDATVFNDMVVWLPDPNADPNQNVTVTITEVGATQGVQLDRIAAFTDLGNLNVYPPGNSITVTVGSTSGGSVLFKNSGTPQVCLDQTAMNYGGPLPCTYPPGGFCPAAPSSSFHLGSAGTFTVLGLTDGNVIISEGATSVAGNVGVGPNDGGALLKATITGALVLDPTAHPDIHPDLVVLGGTTSMSLSGASGDAVSASAYLAGLAPTQAFGDITNNVTFTSGGATNVIRLNSVNMVKRTLTIVGSASDVFIFNVTGQFNFSSSQMILNGVRASNVIWNFPGTGGDIDIFKSVTVAYGIFLAPLRNEILDGATVYGAFIGAGSGSTIKIHSAAQVKCP